MPKTNHTDPELSIIVEDASDLEGPLSVAIHALARQGQVYRRGRTLVVPDRSVFVNTKRGLRQQLVIQALDVANLRRYLVEAAQFMKPNRKKDGLVPTLPSHDLCLRLLNYVSDKVMPLPPLNGVMTTPFLRRDLCLCETPGYDAATGVFYDPCEAVFPALPVITRHNARELAQAALKRLAEPLRGYIFDGDGQAVALAMLLTGFTVHITATRPGFLVEAPVYGSGKTMLIELVALLLSGEYPPLISLADLGMREELNKQLDTALLRGQPCVALDNARGDLSKFGRLVTLLTAAKLSVRVFYTQTDAESENNFVITVSGNNVTTSADMARRLLRARIDTGLEYPDRKHFDFDPRDEVLAKRAELCIDALTVLIAYQVAGAPPQDGRAYGSYSQWARLVRDPLMWLGLADIVPSNDDATVEDQDRADLFALLETWAAIPSLVGAELTAEELIEDAVNDPTGTLKAVLLTVAADGKRKDTISSRRLGWWFKRNVGRRVQNLGLAKRNLESKSHYRLVRYPNVSDL